mmetsp:Transcript_30533/g.70403  ORF Transcript_30533/g.70403 Transcript_30533/m.70403 type:complete len:862 (+) Transcript_30533:143-2728(+)
MGVKQTLNHLVCSFAFLFSSSVQSREPDRRTAATNLDIEGAPDLSGFLDEAQVARSTAAHLSIARETITPSTLLEILHLNLQQSDAIYGAAIAFEPNSYPWFNGSVDPAFPGLSAGVPSSNGTAFWHDLAQPYTLPETRLWTGVDAILYAPYIARGGILMDLADAYNHFLPSTEWYHKARSKFLNGELGFLDGVWSEPYFDAGAGNVEMVTFSVPFTRKTPVPSMGPVPADFSLPYGLPENSARDAGNGDRYFWGIATVDIEMRFLTFRCSEGEIWDSRQCKPCPEGTFQSNQTCQPCQEFEVSDATRSRCEVNFLYLVFAIAFHVQLLTLLISGGIKLKRRLHILSMTHEKGGLKIHFCNKHFMSMSTSKKAHADMPTLTIFESGFEILDKPPVKLHFKVVGEAEVHILYDANLAAEIGDIPEVEGIQGYARFKLGWELSHVTLCRVPIGLWLLLQGALAAGSLAMWRLYGLTVVTGVVCACFICTLSTCAVLGVRHARRFSARRRQLKRAELLNEKELLGAFSDACWTADQMLERKTRESLMQVGWNKEDLDDLTRLTLKTQSQEAGVSVAYLLCDSFRVLAQNRSQLLNPTFHELKDVFFFGDDPIGKNITCPRDGRLGCALVDTLQRPHRRRCTHYLSWTWQYSVDLIQDALCELMSELSLKPSETFLYMCFFVNNQYRILYDGAGVGSVNLEEVFETTIHRVGQVVAILDDWKEPRYLTRIWTIFEQFTAIKLEMPVTMIMPQKQNMSLIDQVRAGEEGILRVTESLCKFETEKATATNPSDETKVKALIRSTRGFDFVDAKVKEFMLHWVGNVVQEYMKTLVTRKGSMQSDEGWSDSVPSSPDQKVRRVPSWMSF